MGKELYKDFLFPLDHKQYQGIKENWEFVDGLDFREDLLAFKKDHESFDGQVYDFMEMIEDKFRGKELPECCGGLNGYVFNWFSDEEFSEYLLRRYPDIIAKIKETNDGELDMYCNYYYWFVWK